mgnify:CR=1 FL=1
MGYYGTYSSSSSVLSTNDILLIAGFVVLLINIAVAVAAASIATQKGHNGTLYGVLCFFTGAIGCIIVAGLPDHKIEEILSVQRSANFFLEKIYSSLSAQKPLPRSHVPTQAVVSASPSVAEENSASDEQWTCKHCGAKNDKGSTFCLSCGENQE